MANKTPHWGQSQRIVVDRSQIDGMRVRLTSQQHHYLCRVLRLQDGDRLLVMNGEGQTWLSQLDGETAELIESVSIQTELSVALHLWIAPPKGSGIEEVIRQATEVGVTGIHPILSDRTLLQPSGNKLDRWRRIALESAEQSERQHVLQISEPVRFQDAEFLTAGRSERYIAVTRQDAPHFLNCLISVLSSQHLDLDARELWIATGPEGGWSDAEVEAAIAAGVQCISLGARILRAVTAPIFAASLVAGLWEAAPINPEDSTEPL